MENMQEMMELMTEDGRSEDWLMGFNAARAIDGQPPIYSVELALGQACRRHEVDMRMELEQARAVARTLKVDKRTIRGMILDTESIDGDGKEFDETGNPLPEGEHRPWPTCAGYDAEIRELYDATREELQENGDLMVLYADIKTTFGTTYRLYEDSLVMYALVDTLVRNHHGMAECKMLTDEEPSKKLKEFFGEQRYAQLMKRFYDSLPPYVEHALEPTRFLECLPGEVFRFDPETGKVKDKNGDIVTDEDITGIAQMLFDVFHGEQEADADKENDEAEEAEEEESAEESN